MRVVVCGGRDYTDEDVITAELSLLPPGTVVVHGDAQGADTTAGEVAKALGLVVEAHPADWQRCGRGAGLRRNAEMLSLGADLVLAFPGGSGTADMVRKARAAEVPVRIIGIGPSQPLPILDEGRGSHI